MNTSRWFTLLTLLLCSLTRLDGQTWERIYPNADNAQESEAKKILPTADGGFLLLIGDGIYGNQNFDVQIMKINGAGVTEWLRTYDYGALEIARDLIATPDGGYAVLYLTNSPTGQPTSHVLKLNGQFDLVYQHVVNPGGAIGELEGQYLLSRPQGLYICGTRPAIDIGPSPCFVYGIDNQGNFNNDYREWLQQSNNCRGATLAPDGSIVLLADGHNPVSDSWGIQAAKLDDQNGGTQWHHITAENGVSYTARDIIAAPGGGYLIAGGRNSQGFLLRLDEAGDKLWKKEFPYYTNPGPDTVNFLGIAQLAVTADGSGYWALSGTDSYIPQIVLLRLDLQGELVWQRVLGPAGLYNYGRDIIGLADGGSLLAGSRSTLAGSSNTLPYAARTNAGGTTLTSGVAGKISLDFEGDCVPDVDTVTYGSTLLAWQNNILVSSATAGLLGEYHMGLEPGDYKITPQKISGAWSFCPDTIPVTVMANDTIENADFTVYFNPQPVDSIYGSVFEDIDGDCMQDPFEQGRPNWTIVAVLYNLGQAQTFTAITDANGHFVINNLTGISNAATGNLSIAPPPNDGLNCTNTCPDAFQIDFISSNSFQASIGVHCDTLLPCPVMDVDIAAQSLRPCFNSDYAVYYCNTGGVTAENAYVEVTLDEDLNFVNASVPWTVNGNVYTFALGNVLPEACNHFNFEVNVPCNEPVGKTYCVEAHAYPDTVCAGPDGLWDGAEVQLNVECDGENAIFTLKNIGPGNMTSMSEYIVIEDNVLLMPATNFQLNVDETKEVTVQPQGAFLRMEAKQVPGFPEKSMPAVWVEGCGTGAPSYGFVNQFPLDDQQAWLDVFCLESVNAYDPNDKQGFPRGVDDEHFIEVNTDLEYMIRFQNTGNAPAIDVEIRDTIPVQLLDPRTVRPGASSHPYVWDMQGDGVVVFKFPGINLPDSAANEEASHGFVKFRVQQRADLPLGAQIRNNAAIYFDFNEAIITNETLHTIGQDFITVDTDSPLLPGVGFSMAPNPTQGTVRLNLSGLAPDAELRFTVWNATGQAVFSTTFTGLQYNYDASNLQAGLYMFRLQQGEQLVTRGKMVKMEH